MDFEADPTERPPWVLGSMIAALLAIVLLWLWDGSDAGVVLQIGTYIVGVIAVVHLASAASDRYRFWYWALMVLLIGLLSVIFHPHPPVQVSLVLAVSPADALFVVGPRSHFRLRIRSGPYLFLSRGRTNDGNIQIYRDGGDSHYCFSPGLREVQPRPRHGGELLGLGGPLGIGHPKLTSR